MTSQDSTVRRCLIADDMRGPRELLRRWMTQLGFEPHLVEDGEAAWQWLQNNHCDLLITDLEMPVLSGVQLLQHLRADSNRRVREMPAVVVTSLLDEHIVDIVQRFGGTTVVLKPLDQSLMNHVVERVVGAQAVETVYDTLHGDGSHRVGISRVFRSLVGRAQSP